MSKHFAAWLTLVGEIRDLVGTVAVILQHWSHVLIHFSLSTCKVIDLLSSVVLTTASSAVTTLDMLNRIRASGKTAISTHRTRNIARAVNLHMHVEIITIVEVASTDMTLAASVDTFITTRVTFTLSPLVQAVVLALF